MWKRARKKPIIIEFREVDPHHFLGSDRTPIEKIDTLEGILYAYPDKHYIIKGIDGELYPIKKEIFYKTYEVIED